MQSLPSIEVGRNGRINSQWGPTICPTPKQNTLSIWISCSAISVHFRLEINPTRRATRHWCSGLGVTLQPIFWKDIPGQIPYGILSSNCNFYGTNIWLLSPLPYNILLISLLQIRCFCFSFVILFSAVCFARTFTKDLTLLKSFYVLILDRCNSTNTK